MRLPTLGALVLAGCNAIFGIHDLSSSDGGVDAGVGCSDGCACTLDTDCGDHMFCDVAPTSRTCRCVAGYTGTESCAWTGVVGDPGFQSSTTWTLGSGTSIETAATGNGALDPGIATATGAGISDTAETFSAEVSQPYVMPRLSRAEPLAIELSAAAVTPGTGTVLVSELGVGSGWDLYPVPFAIETSAGVGGPQFSVTRTCLGEAQYAPETSTGSGAPQTLDLAATLESFNNNNLMNSALDFDHFEIIEPVAGECPTPGTAPNGDCEGSGGWTFHATDDVANDGAMAGYVAGAGAGSSRGVQLQGILGCDQEQALLPISIPLPLGSAATALSVYHQHTGGVLDMLVAESVLALSADSAGVTDTYCLPAPLQGVYTELSIVAGTTSMCGTAVTQVADVDDVTLASDPRCPMVDGIVDPSFESRYQLADASVLGTTSIQVVDDGTAPDGSNYLKLVTNTACDEGEWIAELTTPADIATGKALAFQYEASASDLSVITGSNKTPLPSSAWTTAKACLLLEPPGKPQTIEFLIDDAQSACGGAETTTAGLDALAIVDDPSCAE